MYILFVLSVPQVIEGLVLQIRIGSLCLYAFDTEFVEVWLEIVETTHGSYAAYIVIFSECVDTLSVTADIVSCRTAHLFIECEDGLLAGA